MILTDFVAIFLASVGEELQGIVGLATARIFQVGDDLLGVGTANGLQVGRVVGVAGDC